MAGCECVSLRFSSTEKEELSLKCTTLIQVSQKTRTVYTSMYVRL